MFIRRATLTLGLVAGSVIALVAQSSAPTPATASYLTPPQVIVDILDAPPIPTATLSPTRETVVLAERRSMPPIAELAQPMLRLAGERINPKTDGPHRTPGVTGLVIKQIASGTEHRVTLPAARGVTLLQLGYSPDGKRYAFGRIADTGIELWTADTATGHAARLGNATLNA